MKVFVDSDVIISSLISKTGAAYLLLNKTDAIERYISNVSYQELKSVVTRMQLDDRQLINLIEARFISVDITQSVEIIKKKYDKYVLDPNDAHIAAGAHASRAKFLITYNIRHFQTDKLKQDFGFIVLSPGYFLQYLRVRL